MTNIFEINKHNWYFYTIAILFLIYFFACFSGCARFSSTPPRASTASVGVRLEELELSLDKAKRSVTGIKGDLSTIDDKAVKIREALKNWK